MERERVELLAALKLVLQDSLPPLKRGLERVPEWVRSHALFVTPNFVKELFPTGS